jgi:flagellin
LELIKKVQLALTLLNLGKSKQGGFAMSLVINHNLMAMNAARNLTQTYGRLSTSTRRLSSGLRVDTAADDAAGLAIRELMRSDVATLHQGIRNANDAISMVQTADGALQIIDEKLIRMKELAEQAATGTYNSDQRLIIDSEYQAMASEITRIAMATDFNQVHLLDGTLSGAIPDEHDGSGLQPVGPMKIHFGTGNDSSEDYYFISIGGATASHFGLGMGADAATSIGGMSISTQSLAQAALAALDAAIISKDNIRANLGALQNRLENTISNLQIQAENLQAAESRISDVDVAWEMTEFVRNQILTQSATAMLAQANSIPRLAMQLIGGGG